MNLTFLHPLFLIAATAGIAPLALHLLSRRKTRRLPFSTLFFLRQADIHTARRHKLVDLLLLVCRILLILLIALALAKPVWRPQGAEGKASGPATRIIILDDSYSARVPVRERPLIEAEREFALSAIETLESRDEAALLLTSQRDPSGASQPTANTALLLAALGKVSASLSAKPAQSALASALRLLSESQKSVREIVIVTDLHKRAFETTGEFPGKEMEKMKPLIYLCPVIPEPEKENLTLAKALIHSPLPFPGFPVTLNVDIENHSAKDRETEISLWNDRKIVSHKKISIPAASRSGTIFKFTPPSPKHSLGQITMAHDDLEEDNTFYYHLPLLENGKALMITGNAPAVMETDGSLFLATALESVEESGAIPSGFAMEYATTDRFELLPLEDYQILFFMDAPRFGEHAWAKLKKYLNGGGHALFFLSPPGSAFSQKESLSMDKEIVPFILESAWGDVSKEDAKTFGDLDEDHPVIRSLKKIPNADFSSVRFYNGWEIRFLSSGIPVRILAKTRDDKPLILENSKGEGRVIFFLSGLSPDSTNLGARPIFIPLLYETIKYLIKDPGGAYILVDEPFRVSNNPPEKKDRTSFIKVTCPDKKTYDIPREGDTFTFSQTQIPGNYMYQDEESVPHYFSVNIDPLEGDLSRIAMPELKKMFPGNVSVRICSTPLELEQALEQRRSGSPLSQYLLFFAAALFLADIYLSNSLLKKKKAREII